MAFFDKNYIPVAQRKRKGFFNENYIPVSQTAASTSATSSAPVQQESTLKPNMPQGIQNLYKGQAEIKKQQPNETRIDPLANTVFASPTVSDPTALQKIGYGISSMGKQALATPLVIIDTLKQLQKNAQTYSPTGDKLVNLSTPVSSDSPGSKLMQSADITKGKATEGLSGPKRFLANTALSIADNITALPAALLNPAAPLAIMGAKAAAQKMYELNEQGEAPLASFGRGVVSGAIEAATEKIPLDMLLKTGKEGAKAVIRSLLKQAGTEATEESVSYILNYVADKAAKDPNATFSLSELGQSALGGAISGGVLGGGAALVGNISNRQTGLPDLTKTQPQPLPVVSQQQATTSTGMQRTVEPQTGGLPYVGTSAQNVATAPLKQAETQTGLPEGVGAAEKGFDPTGGRVANVLTSSPKAETSIKQVVKENLDFLKRKFTDSGATLDTISKTIGDKTLYQAYNNAKQASSAANIMIGEEQTDIKGNRVGDSLKDVFKPIRAKGDDYYKAFSEYMFHEHNVDRMAQGKPVFGETVTADISKARAAELLSEHPEFKKYADQVYQYLDNLMQYRIDSGLVSKKQAAEMKAMYPHYVPTYRQDAGTGGATSVGNTTLINTGIKRATGSSLDLMPLHETIARQTMQTVQAAKRNVFGNRLMKDVYNSTDKLGAYVYEINDGTARYDIDSDDVITDAGGGFIFYENGKPVSLKVSKGVEGGLKSLTSTGTEKSAITKGIRRFNENFKRLVTAWNPVFTPRNFARDIQDAGLYTKDAAAFVKNYPKAVKEIATNGEMWKKYKALGGLQASYFDFEEGYTKDRSAIRRNTIDRIEDFNVAVEQAPRLAEFMATVEKGDGSYENLMDAMYNAADVTVNFGRSGDWGKVINKYFTPFFNPSMQGASRMIRRFTENASAKDWATLAIRATVLGIAPTIINSMIYQDDDDWEKLNQRDKDINFLFKIGDHEWLKIPKGRVLSVFGMAADRTIKAALGDKIDVIDTATTAIDQTAPSGIISNSIISGATRSQLFNPNDPGKTWYGANIESERLQKYKPGERYDESTDVISKTIGGALNISPKKLNNLIDSYTGVIGDFVLPALTPRAETNPLAKAFTIDAVTSNNISDKFYQAIDDTTYAKNSKENPSKEAALTSRYLSKQSTAVSALYDEIRTIETSNITDAEKRTKTREVRELINGIQATALDSLDKYEQVAKRYSDKVNYSESITQTAIASAKEEAKKQGKPTDTALINQLSAEFRKKEVESAVDNAYLMTNKEVFGAEYALQTYNKDIYAKAQDARKTLISYDAFFNVYFAQKDISGDKDRDGNTISLSASKNKKAAIDKAAPALTQKQKEFLYKMFDVSEKVWSGLQLTGLPDLTASIPKLSLPKLPSIK